MLIRPKVLDTQLSHPIYYILQGVQLEVGHDLIGRFHYIMHLCQSKLKLHLLFASLFYVTCGRLRDGAVYMVYQVVSYLSFIPCNIEYRG